MRKWCKDPVKMFLYSGMLCTISGVILGFFSNESMTVDIQLHDTYLLIAYMHIPIIAGILFLIFSGMYKLLVLIFEDGLNSVLSCIHSWGTIIIILSFVVFILLSSEGDRPNSNVYQEVGLQAWYSDINFILAGAIVALVLIQLLVPIDIGIATFRRIIRENRK